MTDATDDQRAAIETALNTTSKTTKMAIDRAGHDHDTDQPVECVCGEVVRDPTAHHCLPIGWTQATQVQDAINATLDRLDALYNDHEPTNYDFTTYADAEPVIEWCCWWHRTRHDQEPA